MRNETIPSTTCRWPADEGVVSIHHTSVSEPLKNAKVIDCNWQAAQEYVPQFYLKQGKVTLFRCKVQDVKFADHPELGWSELVADGLAIEHIPGRHLSLLKEPIVQVVAEKLKFCLERSQTENLLLVD